MRSSTQSYQGRWSSNSNVQIECVMFSSASSIGCAYAYSGYTTHFVPVMWCSAKRMR